MKFNAYCGYKATAIPRLDYPAGAITSDHITSEALNVHHVFEDDKSQPKLIEKDVLVFAKLHMQLRSSSPT